MKLIDNWKEAYKWASTRCMALAIAVQGTWMFIPDDLKSSAPHWVAPTITVVLLILGLGGRVTQSGVSSADTDKLAE